MTARRGSVLLSALLLWGGNVFAADLTVAWDANPVEEEVVSYTVHWGQAPRSSAGFAGYPQSADVTGTTYALPELAPGQWYVAVTAYNRYGLRSDYSSELYLGLTKPSTVNRVNVTVTHKVTVGGP